MQRIKHVLRTLVVAMVSFQAAVSVRADDLKIVSIGGDITEIVYALGKSDAIVAVDTTSVHPAEALRTKKNVGYMRALSTEGVLATGATAIIASERAGPPEVVAALKSSSVDFHEIREENLPEGVTKKIKSVGGLIGAAKEADAMAASVAAKFSELEKARTKINGKKRVLFVLATQDGRATVGGKNTSADAILELSGVENAASSIDGFKPVTDEQLVEIAPDAVVVMNRSGLKTDPVEAVRQLQGLRGSPALTNDQIFGMDGQYLIGFGPRAPDAAMDLMRAVYPDLASQVKSEQPG
jgi:iron complex transport system substrate-binding protein